MTTYYINADTGDNNTGNGSISLPWLTLSKFYSSSQPGDTVIAQNSVNTYAISDMYITNRTVQGEEVDGSGAIFDGGGAQRIWQVDRGATVLEKITIRNVSTKSAGHIYPNEGSGSNSYGYPSFIFLTSDSARTIPVSLTMRNVVMSYVTGGQFGVLHSWCGPATFDVASCLFDHASSLFQCSSSGTSSQINLSIVNCTYYSTGSTSKILFGGPYVSSSYTLKNTIFVNASGSNPVFEQVQYSTNFQSRSISNCCINGLSSVPAAVNSITSDPLFVDPNNGLYSLKTGSPCIGTGTLL